MLFFHNLAQFLDELTEDREIRRSCSFIFALNAMGLLRPLRDKFRDSKLCLCVCRMRFHRAHILMNQVANWRCYQSLAGWFMQSNNRCAGSTLTATKARSVACARFLLKFKPTDHPPAQRISNRTTRPLHDRHHAGRMHVRRLLPTKRETPPKTTSACQKHNAHNKPGSNPCTMHDAILRTPSQ